MCGAYLGVASTVLLSLLISGKIRLSSDLRFASSGSSLPISFDSFSTLSNDTETESNLTTSSLQLWQAING